MDTNTDTAEKTEFTLAGTWEEDTQIRELPYYVWMKINGVSNPHRIDTKIAFLQSQGFQKAIHKLARAETILRYMNYCEDMYYQWEILAKGNPPTI